MRYLVPLILLAAGGCYDVHGAVAREGDASLPPPDARPPEPRDAGPRLDAGPLPDAGTPPPVADFVFYRGPAPDRFAPFQAEEWRRLRLDDRGGAESRALAAVPGQWVRGQRAAGGLAVAEVADGMLVSDGGGATLFGPSGAGVHLAEAGQSIVLTTPDAVLVYERDGTGRDRYLVEEGASFVVDPQHRFALRSRGGLEVLPLAGGGARTLPAPFDGYLDSAYFSERFAVLVVAVPGDPFDPATYELYRLSLSDFEITPLGAIFEDRGVAAYDRCQERLLLVDSRNVVFALDLASGAVTDVAAPTTNHRPMTLASPFLALSALSPDGRTLLWFADRPDGGAGEPALVVGDLETSEEWHLEVPGLPSPWRCCEFESIDATLAGFRGDHVSFGVGRRTLVPICDCAPLDGPDPAALRLNLAQRQLSRVPSCGQTVPWLLDDGALLTCRSDGERSVLTRDDPDDDGGPIPLTEGPWDTNARPMYPAARGCSAPRVSAR